MFFFFFFPVSTHGGLSDPADQNHHVVKRQIDNRRVVCYYANWAVYRKGTAKFTPQNINPYLCTHLIYAFAGLGKDDTIQTFDKYQDLEKGKLRNWDFFFFGGGQVGFRVFLDIKEVRLEIYSGSWPVCPSAHDLAPEQLNKNQSAVV